MRSFELPIDRWKSIENNLRTPLDEIEAHRSRLLEVETRLSDLVERLHAFGLGAPFGRVRTSNEAEYTVVPLAETLAFDKRHATTASAAEYSAMRGRIENNYDTMTLSCDLLREMHKFAVGAKNPGAGEWKTRRNFFPIFDAEGTWVAARITTPIEDVPATMERLHDYLHAAISANVVNPLLWIAAYALDIFAMHPFQDGNGRVTRLAMLLLLYQSGHFFARHIGIEGMISRRRSAYTATVIRSYDQWSAARHDPTPWCRFLVDLVLDAYREFSARTAALSTLADQTTALSDAIAKMPTSFRSDDLSKHLPGVPETITTVVLHRMKECGTIRLSLSGNEVQWLKDGPEFRA